MIIRKRRKLSAGGFTLIEMSIVLVIIGVILGAVSIGKDLQRNAEYQKISATFIQGWREGYINYYNRVGHVLGDDPEFPTRRVDGAQSTPDEICGDDLYNPLVGAGVAVPTGRGSGHEDQYVYVDNNGSPQQLSVCFQSVEWAIPKARESYENRFRNVMVIKGITAGLAMMLDKQIDGNNDARFGNFREVDFASSDKVLERREWTVANSLNSDDDAEATTTAYLLLD